MRPRLPAAARRAAWLLAAALCAVAPASSPSPAAAQAQAPAAVRVVVAVLPFRVHSARPLEYLERSLADLLATRLEASGRVEVVESITVRETLVERGDERTDAALRRLAADLDADYVVAGSLTELAGRYSLDVRVTPVGARFASRTLAFTASGDDELLDRVDELADRVLETVGSASPRARVTEVRIEGVDAGLAEQARALLRLAPGAAYDSATAQADLARLRALPGVAAGTFETERGPVGVEVRYRLVPSERLLAEGAAGPASDRVAEVVVRGNQRIEANAIRARIGTRAGDPYDPRRIASDLRAIHGLGFFRNARVLSEDTGAGRRVIFEVEENPVVRQVSISGNDSLDSDEIRDTLTLTTGSTLDLPLLFENRERIEALYKAQGFHLASVQYEVRELRGDAVAVDFEVDEGDKLRLRRIEFEGNAHFSDEELAKGLRTRRWRWHSFATRFFDRSGTYAEPIFMQDLRTVQERYLNAGYLQAEIGEPRAEPRDGKLVVRVGVTEGPRFRVGEVDVAGDPTLDLEGLRELVGLEVDEHFDRSQLSTDVEALEAHYANRGFYFAKVNPQTRVDEKTLRVDVTFAVEKGPLHFIRRIEIAGNTNTIDPVIRREMQLVEGQLYSQRAVELSRARIRSLGFFEEVDFEPRPTDEPDQLDLDVKVTERPTGSLSFGAGFSSQDGFVITGGLNQSNLFGRGYSTSLSADIGGQTDRFFLSFTDPYFLGSTFSLSAQAFRTDLQFEDFQQQQNGVELALGHALDRENRSRGFLRYSFASREIDEDDNNINAASALFRQIIQGAESTSLVGLSYRRDTRDDRIAPSSGNVLGASLEYAGLGGFSQFVRMEGRGSFFAQPPGWFPDWVPFRERSAFVLGVRAGWALPFNDIADFDVPGLQPSEAALAPVTDGCRDGTGRQVCLLDAIDGDLELPLTERYFVGGIGPYQLRGFRARSVGPRRAILTRNLGSGRGGLFFPVGVAPADDIADTDGDGTLDTVIPAGGCADYRAVAVNGSQGNKNGRCNDLDDEDIDDFEDLAETDVIGGNKFMTVNFEYRFPISDELGLMGVLFVDMGNAFSEDESLLDVDLWRYGTGFGVQWFSPFGPLQAFVGVPLDRLEVEDSTVFEFSVGGSTF